MEMCGATSDEREEWHLLIPGLSLCDLLGGAHLMMFA